MQDYKTITDGKELEDFFHDLFGSQHFNFSHYYKSTGNIPTIDIGATEMKGDNIEIDAIIKVEDTTILLEYTLENFAKKGAAKEKINKFIRNSYLFEKGSNDEKFKYFSIDDKKKITDIKSSKDRKYVFIGTSRSFDNIHLDSKEFTDYPSISKNLYLIRPHQLDYFIKLVKAIGSFAKNELIDFLDISIQPKYSLITDYFKVQNKLLTPNSEVFADIYTFKATASDLLNISKIPRSEGYPLIAVEEKDSYQRLFKEKKLKDISENFIQNDRRRSYPTSLTAVLSPNCFEKEGKLHLPISYGSLSIIDGQHRLYAYAWDSIDEDTRNGTELIITAISFKSGNDSNVREDLAAKIFCEINSKQSKVEESLIVLLKYDILKEFDHEGIAGKIVKELNSKGPLQSLFYINPLKKTNSSGIHPIKIKSVTDELTLLLQGKKTNGKLVQQEVFKKLFKVEYSSNDYAEESAKLLVKNAQILLTKFFNFIGTAYKEDWAAGNKSAIFSSKFFAGFIRLFRHIYFDLDLSKDKDVQNFLREIRSNLPVNPSSMIYFDKSDKNIPFKESIGKIFTFLREASVNSFELEETTD